jgi:hypothetical protein
MEYLCNVTNIAEIPKINFSAGNLDDAENPALVVNFGVSMTVVHCGEIFVSLKCTWITGTIFKRQQKTYILHRLHGYCKNLMVV